MSKKSYLIVGICLVAYLITGTLYLGEVEEKIIVCDSCKEEINVALSPAYCSNCGEELDIH